MPEPGQEETVRIVALDRSFHIGCYKCEVRGGGGRSLDQEQGLCGAREAAERTVREKTRST